MLGEDHPDTLASRNNLAHAYQAAGDLGGAIPLHEQTLTGSARVLGQDHPATLTSRNNLAHAYQAAGDVDRAIWMFEQILTSCAGCTVRTTATRWPPATTSPTPTRRPGMWTGPSRCTSRPSPAPSGCSARPTPTLTTRNNLAFAYHAAGDLGGAIPIYQQPLADGGRVLGPDHPATLTARHNLAGAYQAAEDLGRAIPLYEQAPPMAFRVLGEDHPTSALVRDNLAAARRQRK